jgi:hypothetical protein
VQSSSFPTTEKETTDADLVKILNYPFRNMIAHDAFEADTKGDGVVFFPVKTRGQLLRLREVWSVQKFSDEEQKIGQFATTVRGIKEGLTKPEVKFGPIDWMTNTTFLLPRLPMRHTMSPALIDHLSRQLPDSPDSNPAASSPETNAQNPDKPQEKE